MRIACIGHSYHQKTRSSDFFLELLRRCGDVDIFLDSSWQSGSAPDWATGFRQADYDCIVVYQSHPAFLHLDADHPNIVFVPMYDAMVSGGQTFWRDEFNAAKVLCFSSSLYREVAAFAPIRHFAQYFPDPAEFPRVPAARELAALFWYRQPPITTELLARLCGPTVLDRLTLHQAPDPEVVHSSKPFGEPPSLRRETTDWFADRAAYLAHLGEHRIFFASRLHEGIGISFLEAMAMGLCVVAPATPTHTEYISHGTNGLLYSPIDPRPLDFSGCEALGARALESIAKGRARWERDAEALVEFVCAPRRSLAASRPAIVDFWHRSQATPAPPLRQAVPKVTVVTVCLNAEMEIEGTLDSVAEQDYPALEYLVWDGGSTDGTRAMLERRAREFAHWEVRPGMRVYAAMSDALTFATGEFVLFLNAGDRFASRSALSALFAGAPRDADVVYGHHVYLHSDGVDELRCVTDFEQTWRDLRSGRIDRRWLGGIPCHQATAVRTDRVRQFGFDPVFRIAADHDLFFRLRRAGVGFHNSDEVIAIYRSGGLSSRFFELCVREWMRIAARHSRALTGWHLYSNLLPHSEMLWAAAIRGCLDRFGGAADRTFGRLPRRAVESTATSERPLPPRGPLDRLASWLGRAVAGAGFGRLAPRSKRGRPGEPDGGERGLVVDFRDAERPRAVTAWSGFSFREDWGRWTDGARAELFFAKPLPARLRLELEAHAFAGNAIRPIRIAVGAATTELQVSEAPIRTYVVDLETSGRDFGLSIDIPSPTSPMEPPVGSLPDRRQLGIGLRSLRVLGR